MAFGSNMRLCAKILTFKHRLTLARCSLQGLHQFSAAGGVQTLKHDVYNSET